MTKPILLLSCATAFAFSGFSQEAITSAGRIFNTNGVNLSWSLGETVVATVDDGSTTLTQGFQQSNLAITAIKEEEESFYHVFPNPTRNVFTIKNTKNTEVTTVASLYQLDGKKIKDVSINTTSTQVNIADLPAGTYLLTINHYSFRILKTN